jgi:hypothetical protein
MVSLFCKLSPTVAVPYSCHGCTDGRCTMRGNWTSYCGGLDSNHLRVIRGHERWSEEFFVFTARYSIQYRIMNGPLIDFCMISILLNKLLCLVLLTNQGWGASLTNRSLNLLVEGGSRPPENPQIHRWLD